MLPSHLWATKPKGSWAADTSVANLVGSGPYRITAWRHGQFVTLEADSGAAKPPAIQRVIWRFTPDPDAALNLV